MPLERIVTVIPPKKQEEKKKRKLRVAAYCRVSTDTEEQQTSYELQARYYTNLITQNPDWELVGIFADEESGGSTRKRKEFNRMLELCRQGKIDRIITKTVSRFARNTLDTIQTVRKLKAKGIGVYFEAQHLDTLLEENEQTLTMYSNAAQGEIEDLSNSMKWAIRKRYEEGTVSPRKSYGYDVVDKKLVIIPNEARIMLMIGQQYLDGYSADRILEEIKKLPGQEGVAWSKLKIQQILSNEKNVGDCLLQKTFVADCLTKKVVRNTGQLPKYYIRNDHPGIFSREMWDAIQAERARRNSLRAPLENKSNAGKFSSKYALTGIVICGECGTPYRRITWTMKGEKRYVWRCINRLEKGPGACSNSPTVEEGMLHHAVIEAVNKAFENVQAIKQKMNALCNTILDEGAERAKVGQVDHLIHSKMEEMMNLVKLGTQSTDPDHFNLKFLELNEEIMRLRNQKKSIQDTGEKERKNEKELRGIHDYISSMKCRITQYDEKMVRHLIQEIEILSPSKVRVVIKGGMEIEVPISVIDRRRKAQRKCR